MDKKQVVDLMESSQTSEQWSDNCDAVKAACGGYPDFWWQEIILSGLGDRVAARWGSDMGLTFQTFKIEDDKLVPGESFHSPSPYKRQIES